MDEKTLQELHDKRCLGATTRTGTHRGVPWEVRTREKKQWPAPPYAVEGRRVSVAVPQSEPFLRCLAHYRVTDVLVVAGREVHSYGGGERVAEGGPVEYVLGVFIHGDPDDPAPRGDEPPGIDDEAQKYAESWIDDLIAGGYAPDPAAPRG